MAKLTFVPALAEAIAVWFPELKGRSIAVSDADITKENLPTMPIAMVALIRETGVDNVQTNALTITEEVLVNFMFEPERYKQGEGKESPFWAYYDYPKLRNRLLAELKKWVSPEGTQVQYLETNQDSSTFAVQVSFRLSQTYRWCPEEPTDPNSPDGKPVGISFQMCQSASLMCNENTCEEETKKCPESM